MIVDLKNGCKAIEYWPFSDGTMSFIIWFNDYVTARKVNQVLRDAGFEISNVNGTNNAFIINHMDVLSDVDIDKTLPSIITLQANGQKVDYRSTEHHMDFIGL